MSDKTLNDSGVMVLSDGRDIGIGGRDQVHSARDTVSSNADVVLSGSDLILNYESDQILSKPDQVLNAPGHESRVNVLEVKKRQPTAKEKMAITVAVSRTAADPNTLSIVKARVDSSNRAVRTLCARLKDESLDDEHNRFNVVFAVIEGVQEGGFVVSVIDAGQRASVACLRMGYLNEI